VHQLKKVKKANKEWRKTDTISAKSKITTIRQKLKVVQVSMGTDTANMQWQNEEKQLKNCKHG